MSFASWLSSLMQPRRRPVRTGARRQSAHARTLLRLEILEDRFAPATHTWSGAGGNALWSNAGNWDTVPTVAEASTSNVVLIFPAVTNETTTDDISGLIVDQLQLQATGYAITLSQTLTLRQGFDQSSSTTFQQISNTTGFTDTISGGTITTTTDAKGTGSPNADLNVGGTLTISSVLGGGTANYDQSSSGTLILSGANTFTGGFDVQEGTVVAQNATALGIPGATVQTDIESGATLDVQANLGTIPITSLNGSTSTTGGFGSLICSTGSGTLGAAVNLNDSASLGSAAVFMTGGAGTLTLSAGITGSSGNTYTGVISKIGAGTTILSGTTASASNTTVMAGTLQVNGTLGSPVSVASGATLAGSGTVGAITTTTNGAVAPGVGNANPVTLTANGYTAGTGSAFGLVITGTAGVASDKLLVLQGTVSLNGIPLSLILTGNGVPVGQSITLIDNEGPNAINGTFSQGSAITVGGQNFSISYVGFNGKSVVITALTAAPSVNLSNSTVPAFHPVGTVVGNLSATELGSGNTFTFKLVSGTGSTGNGSFTISNNQLLSADAFDTLTQSSYSILVQATDQNNNTFTSVLPITITAVPGVSRSGQTLTVIPAAGSNTFSFTPSGSGQDLMVLNGTNLAVDVASVNTITYTGSGADTVTLNAGAGTGNTATLLLGSGSLQGTGFGYTANASFVGILTVTGGAKDTANFTPNASDSTGKNQFIGAPADSVIASGPNQKSFAVGFGTVTATSTVAYEDAFLSDTAGNDTFTCTQTTSTQTTCTLAFANGNSIKTTGFSTVLPTVSGTNDSATLNDTTGTNLFVNTPQFSFLIIGLTAYVDPAGFTSVSATAGNSKDQMFYYDIATGSHTFTAGPTSSSLISGGVTTTAHNFDFTVAIAVQSGIPGGAPQDTAVLTGSSGTDAFTGAPAYGLFQLLGATVLNEAVFFTKVTATQGAGGTASATLTDVPGVTNTFTSTAAKASLSGSGNIIGNGTTTSYFNEVDGFTGSVIAKGGAGSTDTANLADTSGNDTFTFSLGQGTAASPAYSYLVGGNTPSTFIEVVGFTNVICTSSAGGSDTADMYGGPDSNTFAGQGNNATLTGSGFSEMAIGMSVVNITATGGISNVENVVGTPSYTLNLIGNWT